MHDSDINRLLESSPKWEILSELPTPKEIIIGGELRESVIRDISRIKKEPNWMLRLRLRAFEIWERLPSPNWLLGVEDLNLENLAHYVKPAITTKNDYESLPQKIYDFYVSLGIPESEAKYLSGLAGVLDSETIIMRVKEWLRKMNVIFMEMEEAVKKYPDLVKKYFSRVYPVADHKFAALHYALWSGGAFVYVPPNVKITQPIEAFFMISSALESQYEHTMVIADESSYIHFIEGCAAPMFPKYSFHNGAVEVYVHRKAHVRFTTIQNWSKKIINFNNKRSIVEEGGYVEWLEGGIGARVSYVYPSAVLRGKNAKASILAVSIANGPYIKDSGAKVYHLAPNTKSEVIAKSISSNGGLTIYRGLIYIAKGARNATSHVQCDSLLLDDRSRSVTIPHNQVLEDSAEVTHEATAGKISEDALFYLQSRGLSEEEGKSLIVLGFMHDLIKELPFEMANILNTVVQLEFSKLGGVG